MADKKGAQSPPQLSKLNDDEVRKQFDPSIQPVPILRTLAVTELEKRRQKQANVLLRPNLSLGKLAVSMAMFGAIVAAVVAWFWWGSYVD